MKKGVSFRKWLGYTLLALFLFVTVILLSIYYFDFPLATEIMGKFMVTPQNLVFPLLFAFFVYILAMWGIFQRFLAPINELVEGLDKEEWRPFYGPSPWKFILENLQRKAQKWRQTQNRLIQLEEGIPQLKELLKAQGEQKKSISSQGQWSYQECQMVLRDLEKASKTFERKREKWEALAQELESYGEEIALFLDDLEHTQKFSKIWAQFQDRIYLLYLNLSIEISRFPNGEEESLSILGQELKRLYEDFQKEETSSFWDEVSEDLQGLGANIQSLHNQLWEVDRLWEDLQNLLIEVKDKAKDYLIFTPFPQREDDSKEWHQKLLAWVEAVQEKPEGGSKSMG